MVTDRVTQFRHHGQVTMIWARRMLRLFTAVLSQHTAAAGG
jgi:hypothetical protein